MKVHRLLPFAVIALAALSLGSGCPTIPKVEDRIVELALGASTTQEFVASGEVNALDDTKAYDLSTLDLAGILDDAGIDPSDVEDVKFSGAQYRVTQPDPTPDRQIQNGTVTVQRGAGPVQSLVSDFSVSVNGATSWQTVTVEQPGADLINAVLADLLAEIKTGVPLTNPVVSVHVSGTSSPSAPTDFKYEIKLNITVVGTLKTKVLDS